MNRRVVAAALTVLLGACASLLGPRTFTLSEHELSQRLAERFPVDRRLLDMLDVRIAAPRVTLQPAANRIGVELDLSLADMLSRRKFPLALSLDSGLRYDTLQSAVTLADVRVQSLRSDALPASLAATVQRFGAPLAEQVLEGTVVHRFTPEQVQLAQGQGLEPGAIDVTPRGVRITLLPRSR